MNIAFVILAVVASMIATSQAGSSKWGLRAPNDILLYKGSVKAEAMPFKKTKTDFIFPAGRSLNTFAISEIFVKDNKNVNGGYGKIKNGGVGSNEVRLQFKSDPGQNIDFTVEIYGRAFDDPAKYPLNAANIQHLNSPHLNSQYLSNASGAQGKFAFNTADADISRKDKIKAWFD